MTRSHRPQVCSSLLPGDWRQHSGFLSPDILVILLIFFFFFCFIYSYFSLCKSSMSLLSHFLEFRINSSRALNILLYLSFPCTELQDYSQHNQPLETEVGLSPIPALTRRGGPATPSGFDTALGFRGTNSGHQNVLHINHLMVLSSKWALASCRRCTVSRLPRGPLSLVKCSMWPP